MLLLGPNWDQTRTLRRACGWPAIGFIGMRAELDGVICNGPRRGKQFTYALLEERAPQARDLEHDEALAELTMRYFSSHGPATAPDFAWWSGLTLAEVKMGLEMSKSHLASETIGGKTYWSSTASVDALPDGNISPGVFLLSAYDEYGVGYKDRTDLLEPEYARRASEGTLPAELFLPQVTLRPEDRHWRQSRWLLETHADEE